MAPAATVRPLVIRTVPAEAGASVSVVAVAVGRAAAVAVPVATALEAEVVLHREVVAVVRRS
jgi:hypothetical protein